MKQIVCPECGSRKLRHYSDVYLVWTPVLKDDGTLGKLDSETEQYDEFFECRDCGHKPSEKELLSWAARPVSDRV
jgi:DNA-directed RNA polymerase subunit RPC12/RpoP